MSKYNSIARDTGGVFQHMFSYTSAATGLMKDIIGFNDPSAVAIVREGNWDWCWKLDEWEQFGIGVLKKLRSKSFFKRVSRHGRQTVVSHLKLMRHIRANW